MARWIQRNIELRGDLGRRKHDSARRLFDALAPLLWTNAQKSDVRRVFFQRKSPDLRLRIRADHPRAVSRDVDAVLRAERGPGGAVVRAWSVVYEPERRRFGGRAGMRTAHRFFHDDTALWLGLDRLDRSGRGSVPRDLFLAGVLNELLLQALGDPAEVWDVWCGFVEALALPEVAHVYPPVLAAHWLPMATAEEAILVEGYRAASKRCVNAMSRAEARGRFSVGRRAYLALILHFTMNRHGLDLYWQARLGHGMVRAWAPRL
jgi:thiopeptide-type bacteriocin biosynthesis protein